MPPVGLSFQDNILSNAAALGLGSQDDVESKILGQSLTEQEKPEVAPTLNAGISLLKDHLSGIDYDKATPQDLMVAAASASNDISKRKLELAAKINANEELSRPQAVAIGLISILPYLIGAAARGKKGLAIGAQASALGGTTAIKGIQAENEKTANQAALEYKELGAQQKTADQLLLDTAKGQINRRAGIADYEEKQKIKKRINPEKGTYVDARRTEIKLGGQNIKELTKAEVSAKEALSTSDWIKESFPSEKPGDLIDGNGKPLAFSSAMKNYGLRKIAEWNPNSPAAELVSKLNALLQSIQNEAAGTQTEGDIARIKKILEGGALITTVDQLAKNIDAFAQSAVRRHNTIQDKIKDVSSGNFEPLTLDSVRGKLKAEGPTSLGDKLRSYAKDKKLTAAQVQQEIQ